VNVQEPSPELGFLHLAGVKCGLDDGSRKVLKTLQLTPMAVSFSNIPADIRVPLFYAEVDNSMANSGATTFRRLIVAQVNDTADSDEIGRLTLVARTSDAQAIGGPGSMMAAMHARHREIDIGGEVWCLPLKLGDSNTHVTIFYNGKPLALITDVEIVH
jgi:hypothetical protein